MKTRTLAIILGVLVVLSAHTAAANPVTVVSQGPGPYQIVGINVPIWNGGVYAGVEKLLVDGVAYNAFCIDLLHFSPTGTKTYTIEPLAVSPEAEMGPEKAAFIQEMWAEYYDAAVGDATEAAAFQLAIWAVLQGTVVGGQADPNWSWLTSDPLGIKAIAASRIAWANANDGPLANVVGLNNPSYQTFAIEGVPDGGATVMLLGGALMLLGVLRRQFKS